jgi:hypothetical protein
MWSRVLVALSFFSLAAQASPPPQEPGTRVTVQLAKTSGELPEPEKMVESLMAVGGGERQVRVIRRNVTDQALLTLDLWGSTVPQADIPKTLRDAFPVLASADIQVSTLDPQDRPKRGEIERELPGEKGTVKKVVKLIKKE